MFVTLTVGDPAEVASVKTLPPLEFRNQFVLASVAAVPKMAVPMVSGTLSVTKRLVVIVMVLKSAVASTPLATVPFSQLVPSLQMLLASLVQVPLSAWAAGALAQRAATSNPPSHLEHSRRARAV